MYRIIKREGTKEIAGVKMKKKALFAGPYLKLVKNDKTDTERERMMK